MKRLFPALQTDGSAAQQSNIVTKLNKLAAAQNARFEAQCTEKEGKSASLVTK